MIRTHVIGRGRKDGAEKAPARPTVSSRNSRSGQAYSFIVVLIIIPLFLFITAFLASTQDVSQARADRILADQMAQLSRNVEDDFSRAVDVSGRRALVALLNQVVLTGQPIDNASLRMQELMLNGTLYGNASLLMFNNTLADWRIKILETPSGFRRNLSYGGLQIRNRDGFSLLATLSLQINLSHSFAAARIEKIVLKEVPISVEGLDDPLYILNSGGAAQKQVVRYPFRSFALQLLSGGTRQGNCTGEAVFSGGGGGDVLVGTNVSGVSGVTGAVGETADQPGVSCYSVGNADAVQIVNLTTLAQNDSTLTLDQPSGVWLIRLAEGLGYYHSFSSSGPDYLMRLEGRVGAAENGLESFVEDAPGIPSKPLQSRVDYQYFSNSTVTGKKSRGLPAWFRIDDGGAGRYNLTLLLE